MQYLHQVGQLAILPALGTEVWVPPAVLSELDHGRQHGIDVPDPAALSWVVVRGPAKKPPLPSAAQLGPGESEVIWLALESPSAVAVLDDSEARRVAKQLGIRFTGILGLLVDAKHMGLLNAVKPVLDELGNRNFHLSARTRETILQMASESP
jgi:predicted nucleic acid-binding protein